MKNGRLVFINFYYEFKYNYILNLLIKSLRSSLSVTSGIGIYRLVPLYSAASITDMQLPKTESLERESHQPHAMRVNPSNWLRFSKRRIIKNCSKSRWDGSGWVSLVVPFIIKHQEHLILNQNNKKLRIIVNNLTSPGSRKPQTARLT